VDLEPGDCVFFSALVLHSSQGNLSKLRRLALASCYTLESNQQFKDAYVPCFPCEVVSDSMLLETADGLKPRMTTAEEKVMLNPKLGIEKARKAD